MKSSEDLRSMFVQLTETGLNLINQAVEAHIANEQAILDLLPTESRKELDKHLVTMLAILETPIKTSTCRGLSQNEY